MHEDRDKERNIKREDNTERDNEERRKCLKTGNRGPATYNDD